MANRLAGEQSPYLLQHAHNPVEWYPWGDEPFERAKKENKPVLVSIGYSACHWCHVMERESFENDEVAVIMNENFINIKVDREEYPDVDHFYMDAVQAISGSGGWPLNVFVTPERVPFYGGTYFPPKPMYNRSSWVQVLERIHEIWTKQQDEVAHQSKQMLDYLQNASKIAISTTVEKWNIDDCKKIAANLLAQADKENGGFGTAPKFPASMAISFLLEHYHFTKNEEALKQALLSLDAMMSGGIYDQVGGGFSRYATDEKWLVPHFEKMLYDNAGLICAYCDAYSIEKAPKYKHIIEETIAFVERELKDISGGYYSALDADSEGVEGKYYTWTWEEWNDVIGDDEILRRYFGITREGNWEHTNILHVSEDINSIAKNTSFFKDEIQKRITEAKQKLYQKLKKRTRPQTDDKSILSWNALMNIALSKAGVVLQEKSYIDLANEHMQWMVKHFKENGRLMHVWKQGKARIDANLEDYAYLIQAMLQLASASEDNAWITEAIKLTDAVLEDFNDESGFFYYTASYQNNVPVRKKDIHDSVMPSANAVMAHNLLLLGICAERSDMTEQAMHMLHQMSKTTTRYSYSFCYWALMLQRQAVGFKVTVCSGPDAGRLHKQLQQYFIPQVYTLTSKKEISDLSFLSLKFSEKESAIFVCTEQSCLPPSHEIDTVLPFLAY
jgi:uncharacterized protein YyaL (SSP411 family)